MHARSVRGKREREREKDEEKGRGRRRPIPQRLSFFHSFCAPRREKVNSDVEKQIRTLESVRIELSSRKNFQGVRQVYRKGKRRKESDGVVYVLARRARAAGRGKKFVGK